MQIWFGSNPTVYQHAWTTSEQGELRNKALPSTQKPRKMRAEGMKVFRTIPLVHTIPRKHLMHEPALQDDSRQT